MTKDKFFEELLSGATWSAGVAFKRSNPLPLDRYSVFSSYEEAEAYLGNAVCYPGQVIAVVESIKNADEEVTGIEATVYVVDVDLEGNFSLKEVGTKPIGDEASIEVGEDGKISLYGFEDAAAQTYPRKKEDGTIEWVTVQELVEGATENTITVGDAKSIVSEKTDTGYTLSLKGFDDAADGQIAVKRGTDLQWKSMPTLADLGGVSKDELSQANYASTSYVDTEIESVVKIIDTKADKTYVDQTFITKQEHEGDIDEVVAIAEGKTNTFVLGYNDSGANNFFNSQEDVVTSTGFYAQNKMYSSEDVKVGDVVLLTQLDIPDRWISAIDEEGIITFRKLDAAKVDLAPYIKNVNGKTPTEQGRIELIGSDIRHSSSSKSISQEIDDLKTAVGAIDYPVDSVNGKTGDVELYATDIVVSDTDGRTIDEVLDTIGNKLDLDLGKDIEYDKDGNNTGDAYELIEKLAEQSVKYDENKLDKTLAAELQYGKEDSDKTSDVATLLGKLAEQSKDYAFTKPSITSNLQSLNSAIQNKLDKPENDSYVLKSVYDVDMAGKVDEDLGVSVVYNREGESTQDLVDLVKKVAAEVVSHDYQIESLNGNIGDLIDCLAEKENKGYLHASDAVTSPNDADGNPLSLYIPLANSKISQSSDAKLVELVSGAGGKELVVTFNSDGLLLATASEHYKVSINGTAQKAMTLDSSAKVNVNQLEQTEGEELILNGGNA